MTTHSRPVGWLGVGNGPVMAAAELFKIRITGKGGHGAVPHLAVDPVLASAHIVTALQSIPSRNVAPLKAAVISVTTLKAGEAFNIIPPYADLTGTIRTFEPSVRETVLRRFFEIVEGVAASMGCKGGRTTARSIRPSSTSASFMRLCMSTKGGA